MIILVADHNALSRELIRELLEGSGQVAEKFGFQQISWYRTTLTDLHAQRPPTFGINHNVAQTPIYGLFDRRILPSRQSRDAHRPRTRGQPRPRSDREWLAQPQGAVASFKITVPEVTCPLGFAPRTVRAC